MTEDDIPKEEIEKVLGKAKDEYLDLTKVKIKEPEKIPKEIKPSPAKVKDKTIEITTEKQEMPKQEIKKPEEKPMYDPIFEENKPKPARNPEPPEKRNKLWAIFKIIAVTVFIILLALSVYFFSAKDFSPDVNVTNNLPETNVNNNYEHTIENNNTIIIQVDEDIIDGIADKILNKLNQTNSS